MWIGVPDLPTLAMLPRLSPEVMMPIEYSLGDEIDERCAVLGHGA